MILGYDDVSMEEFLAPGKHGNAIGQHGETTYWQKLGVKHDQEITLKVFRAGINEILEIPGRLLARKFYRDSQERRSLGPGGPPSMSSDGFSGSWSGWYEKLVSKMSYILDGGWDHKKINSKRELKEHEGRKKRVDFLIEHYPGLFADCVLSDWHKVYDSLYGKEIDSIDLEYREIGAKRVEIVKQEAEKEWEKMHKSLEEEMIPAFPVVGVDDRDSVKDKIVKLPWITSRNIINDLGQTYAVIGNRVEGFYFTHLSDSIKVRKFYDLMHQYQMQVNPKLIERYQYIGRITGEPALITYDRKAVTGLMVEIIAARAGHGEFFVDLQKLSSSDNEEDYKTNSIRFAGQDRINQFAPIKIQDEASPQEVMEVMIEAVKMAHQETWKSLFATWRAFRYWGDHIVFDPSYVPSSLFSSAWEQSRRLISDKVYDIRVDKTGPIRRKIIQKNSEMQWPDIDEIDVFVDHYGLEEGDGKYRSFLDVTVKRKWTMQRLDEGPWRIVTIQAI